MPESAGIPHTSKWRSPPVGASTWSSAERQAYANDLQDPRLLIAVSAASNRSKSDQDPAEWLLTHEPYRCQYVADWVAMKLRWGLSVDRAEQDALTDQAAACPDTDTTGTHAR